MERVAQDILSKLPVTKRGNKHILVIGDYFSKWIEALPIPDMSAETVSRTVIESFICRFGVPLSIHSDQGRNFESEIWKGLCSMLKMHKTRTTPYHPQSDGFIEKFNSTLLSMLRASRQEDKRDWDEMLPFLTMAYRSSVNETTGFTPNMIMMGREITLPIDMVLPSVDATERNYAEFVENIRNHMHDVQHEVRKNTNWAVEHQRKYYDLRSKDKLIKTGDKVWLDGPILKDKIPSKKLKGKRTGPHLVIDATGGIIFQLAMGKDKCTKVHVDRLHPYYGNKHFRWMNPYLKQIEEEQKIKPVSVGVNTD
jgi:hypothetical protein